jgi:ribonuclease E
MLEIERQNRDSVDGATGSGGSGSTGVPGAATDNDGKAAGTAKRPRRAVTRPAGPPAPASEPTTPAAAQSAAPKATGADGPAGGASADPPGNGGTGAAGSTSRRRTSGRSRTTSRTAAAKDEAAAPEAGHRDAGRRDAGQVSFSGPSDGGQRSEPGSATAAPAGPVAFQPPLVIFQAPEIPETRATPTQRPAREEPASAPADRDSDDAAEGGDGRDDGGQGTSSARRRRRGGRGRGKSGVSADGTESTSAAAAEGQPEPDQPGQDASDEGDEDADGTGTGKRRRRRRRSGSGGDADQNGAVTADDPPNTVTHVRPPREKSAAEATDVRAIKGSTRLEAKRQRRREGRETGRRRPPIITESEFLARREAVERVMVVRQHGDRTQIAVLEDGVLVEHYVDKASHQSYVGNVYLGKVQNVLPSMEAAFVDIGKGRNAVLYAGEVNFDASGLEGESKRIESALKSGQSILVQVTKDPIGHKGARLTSQVSLPGRYLVYVPGASMTGISRKLPDTERSRLKQILKQVMPEHAGVIVRTAAEGASEEELARDVARLAAQWEAIEKKAKTASAPDLLYSEPDLTLRVVRDIFNEDFSSLVIASDSEWDLVDEYVRYVAPHLADRMQRWDGDKDVFAGYRIDEQLAKALERKVWLPSGGSLVIDHTEAMTVIDVNTGKFTGQGGNLEQTVTRNNLEAAEEIVRQLRLRDLGGIIVIDFIDMVLESNRELVLRRLLECLARDRTKHQVAEVTSLGLVQMTRKRVGSGLLEAFSVSCEHCNGRGVITSLEPVDHSHGREGSGRDGGGRDSGGRESGSRDSGGRESGGHDGAGKGGQGGRSRNANRPGGSGRSGGRAAEPAAEPAAATADGPSPDAAGTDGTGPESIVAVATEPAGTEPGPAAPNGAESIGTEPVGPDTADRELAHQDGASTDDAARSSGGGRFGRLRSGRGRRSGAGESRTADEHHEDQTAEGRSSAADHPAVAGDQAAHGQEAVEPATS